MEVAARVGACVVEFPVEQTALLRYPAWRQPSGFCRGILLVEVSENLLNDHGILNAMILTAPPQARQVSMSMLNTRFSRCAQVIAARRSAGVGSC